MVKTRNGNKNQPEVSRERLTKLGILKVLSVVISEDEETKYKVIKEDGTIDTVSASELE